MITRIYSNIIYFISRNLFKIWLKLFFKFSYTGKANIPKRGAFLIAANHVSYMDPPALGACCYRRLYFISAGHLLKSAFARWWYTSVGCIIIKKGEADHRIIKKMLNYLKSGRPIAIFPEGTRSEDGNYKEPLTGVGFLALKAQVPVVPCIIKGTGKALPKGAKKFSSTKVSVHIGKRIDPKDFSRKGSKKEAYRLFSQDVMESIIELDKANEG